MYKMLTEVCLELNPTKNSRDKDVGCGKYNRHQTAATTLLSSSEVKEVISIMKSDFSIYREKMTCSKRFVLRERLELFHELLLTFQFLFLVPTDQEQHHFLLLITFLF